MALLAQRMARLACLADDDDDRGEVGGGARHILRLNAERLDSTAAQTYGYLSELYSSPRHTELDPGLRFGQLQVLLLHYLALAEDGALPAGSAAAAWRRLPRPPFCDADGRPRELPKPEVSAPAVATAGEPVASRRHAGDTPAVKLKPAVMAVTKGMKPAQMARRRFYDEAVAIVERLLQQTGGGAAACSRLRAELQYVGGAAALAMSKLHARLAVENDRNAWSDLARLVLSSRFLYEELGVPRGCYQLKSGC